MDLKSTVHRVPEAHRNKRISSTTEGPTVTKALSDNSGDKPIGQLAS